MNGVLRGPFFGTDKAAAEYCGMSLSSFGKYKKEYHIPKNAGPGQGQYAASDLDEFMANPEGHKLTKKQKKNKSISLKEMGM